MGYRKVPTIYELVFEDGDLQGLVVRMKSIKLGRVRRLVQVTEGADDDQVLDNGLEEMLGLFADGLVSWNLEEEDGTPVPATLEGIEDQEAGLVLTILRRWLNAMTGVSHDLGKDSTSGSPFPVEFPTMERL